MFDEEQGDDLSFEFDDRGFEAMRTEPAPPPDGCEDDAPTIPLVRWWRG